MKPIINWMHSMYVNLAGEIKFLNNVMKKLRKIH